jgi:hypothetical protein
VEHSWFILLTVLLGISALSQDYEKEMLESIAVIEKTFENVEIKGTHRIFDISTNEPRKTVFIRYLSLGEKRKLELLDESGGVLRLSVVTSDLAFSAVRKSTTEDFVFLEIGKSGSIKASVMDQIQVNSKEARGAFSPTGLSLEALLEKIKVVHWNTSEDLYEPTIELSGETNVWTAKDGEHYNSVKLQYKKTSGLTFEEFEVRRADTDKIVASSSIVREYSSESGMPVLQKIRSTSKDEKGIVDAYSEFEVQEIVFGKVQDTEFVLEGNDLDDLVTDQANVRTPFQLAFFLFLISTVLLVLGYVISKQARSH